MTAEELRSAASMCFDNEQQAAAHYLSDAADEVERLTARMAEATQILRRCKATCSPARVEEIDEFLNAIASEATK